MIKSYPKIFALGDPHIYDIFNEEVEITEKIDGSQFAFGVINGELCFRSKGAIINQECPPDMFKPAVEHILSIADRIPNNHVFYGETLQKPKHNVLKYNRVPKNHIALFAAQADGVPLDKSSINYFAEMFNIESVPVIYIGTVDKGTTMDIISSALELESVLGGCNIEGVVVKNYKEYFVGGQLLPVMQGKYVSEVFKEVHKKSWTSSHTGRGKWDAYKESFRTEARWDKAIQHLREKAILTDSPKDIGILLKEIYVDILEEEKENIKNALWTMFGLDVVRTAQRGFPEYYKNKLIENIDATYDSKEAIGGVQQ